VVYPILTNDEMTTQSQRYNCFTRNGGNAIQKHAGPEAKCSNPTTALTLIWARNAFRGNFKHFWMLETGTGQQVAQFHERLMMVIMMKFIFNRVSKNLFISQN